MNLLNILSLAILIVNSLIADSISGGQETEMKNHLPGVMRFNSLIKKLDLNTDIQDGYSITQSEYSELLKNWIDLSKAEKVQILFGSSYNSVKNTLAQILLFAINDSTDWQSFIMRISCFSAKYNSLTLSNVKSLMSLETAHSNLLDLFHNGQNMFVSARLIIHAKLKIEAYKRQDKSALDRLSAWENLINTSQNFSIRKKIETVNNFFNELIQGKSDHENERECDYWQSPIETLVRGLGDCEDFALAKYVSLRLLGIPKNQLFLGILRLPKFGELHAVLMYYPIDENDPYVLDNLSFEYLGTNSPHIVKLSAKISQCNVKPLIGFNENLYIEFKRGFTRCYLDRNPMSEISMFTIAINNSQSLLANLTI